MRADIVLEPAGRNTAPAIALAALAALEKTEETGDGAAAETALLVLPSDHAIEPAAAFHAAVRAGLAALEADPDRLMTFGVLPTRPETGFGYLVRGGAARRSVRRGPLCGKTGCRGRRGPAGRRRLRLEQRNVPVPGFGVSCGA